MYTFFDTETTGLPKRYNAPPTELDNWPRVVQVAWLTYNEKGKKIASNDCIIKPDGFKIPEDAYRIHGITTEIAAKKGIPLARALKAFSAEIKKTKLLVAHNIKFDLPILKAEYLRTGIPDALFSANKLCTMESSVNYCRIPRPNGGYKWPRLSELYAKLFKRELKGSHDALVDAKACAECFFELKKRGVIG